MNKGNYLLMWQLHAKNKWFKQRVAQAHEWVRESLAMEPDYLISWSGGKDSTAMLHLVRSVAPDIPIIIQFDDCDWPEKRPYVEDVAESMGFDFHSVEPDFSIWDAATTGEFGVDSFCAQDHFLTREGFINPLEDKRRELGCNGVFMGLRKDESKGREMNYASRGATYQRKDGTWRSNPLSKWSATDVFAYLVTNLIPLNPLYFQNAIFPPEEIRISWALPTPTGFAKGQMQHLAKYYPQQYRKLKHYVPTA